MIEHTVADTIKKVAKGFVEDVSLDGVCPYLFEKVCKENGWTFELVEISNWEGIWWAIIKVDSTEINISGCMYYGYANVEIING